MNSMVKSDDYIKFPDVPTTVNTSDNNLVVDFYEPCLKWAKRYDRAVGFFTSGWIRTNAMGMSYFAANGGRARWITSPIMEEEDFAALVKGKNNFDNSYFINILEENIILLKESLEEDTLNSLAWMVYDNIIEFKFAIPTNKLEGDFHDKFGIFTDSLGNQISFNGSVNDSYKGTVNYESLKVFKSWEGLSEFIHDDQKRFNRLWNNKDINVSVYDMPKAIENMIFKLRTTRNRPYKDNMSTQKNKWRHQDEAVEAFLKKGNGILEMATGTGKTRTSIRIINKLLKDEKIKTVILTVYGTDLLDQWYDELLIHTDLNIYRYYSSYKDLSSYMLATENSVLLVSRNPSFLEETIKYMSANILNNAIIVCDEVHGFGSSTLIKVLKGKIKKFKYRLGLSATPEREYDGEGNKFINDEIGDVIYRFGIEDAIKRGILCEFDYYPLEFNLTEKERKKTQNFIAAFKAREKAGEHVDYDMLYIQIARVKKLSKAKLPLFSQFLRKRPNILDRSIIFVETKEYGMKVQKILINFIADYHTYYGEDNRNNLDKFSDGDINCLVTSKRISEGIDIQSVKNIILFSTDRARLQTIQRIGRCLRIDPNEPNKRAGILDYICLDVSDSQNKSDIDRKEWLETLSQTKKEE